MRRWIIMAALVSLLVNGCGSAQRTERSADAKAAPEPAYVFVNEDTQAEYYGRGARLDLRWRRFDKLDGILDSLRAVDGRWPSGASELRTVFARGFGEVTDKTDAGSWERHLDQLRDWVNSRPQSANARIALAQALIGRAWAARGGGWSNTVSGSEWNRFHGDLDEAGQILGQVPADAKVRAEWFDAQSQVLHGRGSEFDLDYRRLKTEAVRRYPHQFNQYASFAGHLMPRWYGAPGEWEQFLDTATREHADSLADEIYARVVLDQSRYVNNVFKENHGVSWERTRQGLDDWHRRLPQSAIPMSALGLLAWQEGSRPDAERAFAALGDTLEADVWKHMGRYEAARAFARGEGSAER